MQIHTPLIHAYNTCKYKAHLLLKGETCTPTEYEIWRTENHVKYARLAVDAIVARFKPSSILQESTITPSDLRGGYALLISPTVQHEQFAFQYDALRRIDGKSELGKFCYVPVLFHSGSKPREEHRRLLAFGALVLARTQGFRPTAGLVVYSDPCKISRLQLGKLTSVADQAIDGINQLNNSPDTPPLTLNRHCQVCQFRDLCITQAQASDDLSLLRSMSETEKNKNNRKGIFTVEQLSYTFRPRKRPKNQQRDWSPYYHSLQALAIREKKTYVLNKPQIPGSAVSAYLDMEGNDTGSSIYLIGLVTVKNGDSRRYSFWANDEEEEPKCFAQLFRKLSQLDSPHIFHYGSYDSRALERMLPLATHYGVDHLVNDFCHNVLTSVYANVYFPTYSNSLKDVGRYLGCTWTHPDSSGQQSVVWRKRWEETRDPTLKDTLIRYNLEDCTALQVLTDFLRAVAETERSDETSRLLRDVEFAADVQNPSDYRRWGRTKYALDAFGTMASCAYFDYQRTKIYYRTNKRLARATRGRRKRRSVRHKPNKVVDLVASKCRYCKSNDLSRDSESCRTKVSLDLRLSKTGIKRWVTEWRTVAHRCNRCKRVFLPKRYLEQKRIGHSLLAWGVHQHISNRTTHANLALTARECFGLEMSGSHFQDIKEGAAKLYRPTYDKLLERILQGDLIHADETGAPLRHHINGYVWVFANMDTVFYFYKPTREGDFLAKLLKDFQGILVTDFYTAYDSLDCAQQKCLVHLMRDLNDDLFKHPFDQELRGIGTAFGELMGPVIETIDRFGLKKRYLSKHLRTAKRFVRSLKETPVISEIAAQYRRRVVKYGDKLFEFMKHDGVPWNNNNAEHSMKPFAKYRRLVKGRITERGLADYLVLLSIHQTCKYRGLSFLDFLCSGLRDVDRFWDGR